MDKKKFFDKIEGRQTKIIVTILIFVALIMALVSSSMDALALSDPINQSLDEFTNLTRADNVLEITQEFNNWVGGAFGLVLIVLIAGSTFVLSLYFTQYVERALVVTTFITVIMSVLFRIVSLVPDTVVYYTIPLFVFSLFFAALKR